ncbi:hypothetical protein NVP1047O_56 [Vibrio phage 1.047.O._10N.286.55.F2]|nr:hypothetical protein NVP1047O_56 [Vibrio phage 1.047.O._10N.286.55.F2]
MKNSDMPAMPVITEKRVANTSVSTCEFSGLTKREMLAMNLMNGILSNNAYSYNGFSVAASMATEAADALLKELEK